MPFGESLQDARIAKHLGTHGDYQRVRPMQCRVENLGCLLGSCLVTGYEIGDSRASRDARMTMHEDGVLAARPFNGFPYLLYLWKHIFMLLLGIAYVIKIQRQNTQAQPLE